jgi:hypothetical protein
MDEGVGGGTGMKVCKSSSIKISSTGDGAAAWSPFKSGSAAPKPLPRLGAATGQSALAAAPGQCASPRVCQTVNTAELLVRGSSLRRVELASSSLQVMAGAGGGGSQDVWHPAVAGGFPARGVTSQQQPQQEFNSPFDQPQRQQVAQALTSVPPIPCQCHEDQHRMQVLHAACMCHLQEQKLHQQQEQQGKQHHPGEGGDLGLQQWGSLRRLFSGVPPTEPLKAMQQQGGQCGSLLGVPGGIQEQQQQLRVMPGQTECNAGIEQVISGGVVDGMEVDIAHGAGQVLYGGSTRGPFSPFQPLSVLDFSKEVGLWGSRGVAKDGRSSVEGSPLRASGDTERISVKGRQGMLRPSSRSPYASPVQTRRIGSIGEKRASSCSDGEGVMGRNSSLLPRRLSQGGGSCGLVVGEMDGHMSADMLIVPT